MPQLWQGRSSKAVDSRVNDFNSSIRFDSRMIEQDIHGSMVHSAMLGKQGIISQQDVDDIHKGLQSILNDLHSGALEIDPNAEDVHTFVEQTLTARVGDAGMHAAQVAQQHPGVSHQLVAKGDRLGTLQMGVTGHNIGRRFFCLVADGQDQFLDLPLQVERCFPQVQADIQRNLVVAAAAGERWTAA